MANQNGAVAELLKNSVTEGDAFVSAHAGGLAYYVLPIMSGYSANVGLLPPDAPRYWCLERDMLLRATVLHENLWASAINIAQTKTASLSFDVEGEKPLNVKRAQEMMLTLDGEGWVKAQSKGVRDYLTCDNGEWWEIVRASSAVGSRILGLVHLDSLRTLRTGDDDRPAMYMDLRGRYHELRDYQVINLTDMPSPAAEFLGVGLCAASRAYSHIYKMANIERYVNEKISGSRPQEIHFINGVMPKQLDAALRGADEMQAQRGAVNFKGALVVPMPAGTTVSGYAVPLSELPDGFDRKQEFDLAVTIYADAIGLDPQDLQPLSGQGLGTGTQSRVLAEKSKGKGLAARQKQWIHEINEKVFPEGVTFIFQERDLDDEKKQAEVEGARAGTRGTMIANGEITAIEARQLAVDSDDLPKEFTPPTGDVTPNDSLSDEEKPMLEGEIDPIPLPDLPAPQIQLPSITGKELAVIETPIERKETALIVPVRDPLLPEILDTMRRALDVLDEPAPVSRKEMALPAITLQMPEQPAPDYTPVVKALEDVASATREVAAARQPIVIEPTPIENVNRITVTPAAPTPITIENLIPPSRPADVKISVAPKLEMPDRVEETEVIRNPQGFIERTIKRIRGGK